MVSQDPLPNLGPRTGSVWQARSNGRLVIVARIVQLRYSWVDVYEPGRRNRRELIKVSDLEYHYVDTGKMAVDLTTPEGTEQ